MGLLFFGFLYSYTSLPFVNKSTLRSGKDPSHTLFPKRINFQTMGSITLSTDLKLSMMTCKESLLLTRAQVEVATDPLLPTPPSTVCEKNGNGSIGKFEGLRARGPSAGIDFSEKGKKYPWRHGASHFFMMKELKSLSLTNKWPESLFISRLPTY